MKLIKFGNSKVQDIAPAAILIQCTDSEIFAVLKFNSPTASYCTGISVSMEIV